MNRIRTTSLQLKAIVTAGFTSVAGLTWYNKSRLIPTKSHVIIHMDVNKTMIMSDAIQDLGFKKALNQILADTSCWGTVTDDNIQLPSSNAINGKIWTPIMIETDTNKVNQHASAPLFTYYDFIRDQMPYIKKGVDPDTKHKRRILRQQFTNAGQPGEQWADIVETLFNKLHDKHIMPAFYNFVDFLYARERNNKHESFSIIFRTFGMDLPNIVEEFNKYCMEKGYNKLCVDLNDPLSHGVMVFNQNELYLVVGTFEMDPRYNRITKEMTLDALNKADRLEFYANNEKVKYVIKGYKDIYAFIRKQSLENKKTMAIRDDYCYWALNGEKSEYGKTMIMDMKDKEIHQIFFDDCASYLVNSRDINNVSEYM
eukprot:412609_1